jgi:hypothetical protein
MPTAALWVIVLIGPGFEVEARWRTQFPDQAQCESWLLDSLPKWPIKARWDVKAECRPAGSVRDDIEE